MEQTTISWGLAFWQVVGLAVFIGVIFLVVRFIKNSDKTVRSLDDIREKLTDLSKKADQLAKSITNK